MFRPKRSRGSWPLIVLVLGHDGEWTDQPPPSLVVSSSFRRIRNRVATTDPLVDDGSFSQLDELRMEVQRRDQELLAMSAKMKTLEEQHQDYQRHITVLKESLAAKEEHYNMLQADVSRFHHE